MSLIKGSMVGSELFITSAKQLASTTEQRFRTFVEDHHPATIAFVRSGHGTLTVVDVATPEQAKQVAAALACNACESRRLAASES